MKLSALNLQYPKRSGVYCLLIGLLLNGQISSSLSLVVNQHENITVTGDLNINLSDTINDTKDNFYDPGDTITLNN